MNKRLLALLAFLNASEAHANQAVDDLVNQSGVLRTNIDIAIQGISGFMYYAPSGGIAPQGVLQAGYITFENMALYNEALANVQNTTFIYRKRKYRKSFKNAWFYAGCFQYAPARRD